METLNNLVEELPGLLPAAAGTMEVAASAPVTSTPVQDKLPESPAEAAASTTTPSTPVQYPLPESPADNIYDTGNKHWLYLKCVEATVNMDCNITPLQFAQHMLKKLRAVEDMDDFDETEWDEGAFFNISSIRCLSDQLSRTGVLLSLSMWQEWQGNLLMTTA